MTNSLPRAKEPLQQGEDNQKQLRGALAVAFAVGSSLSPPSSPPHHHMDSYPEVLLAGVSPLVLTVNAISNEAHKHLYEKFLDVITCMDEGPSEHNDSGSAKPRRTSFLRLNAGGEDNYLSSSDDEEDDDLLLASSLVDHTHSLGLRTPPGALFGRSNRRRTASKDHDDEDDPNRLSVAKALDRGQGFFQRARIQSVSHRHAFPPSKDPDASRNLTEILRQQAIPPDQNQNNLQSIFAPHLRGILPHGWLEKHVNALPSVILVVCCVTASSAKEQDAQDQFLYQTVEHLAFSLVPKRRCRIHVVGLLDSTVTPHQGDGWSRAVLDRLLYQSEEDYTRLSNSSKSASPNAAFPLVRMTLIQAATDLETSGLPASPAWQDLYHKVRHDCGAYYQAQVRRCKTKLRLLAEGTTTVMPPPDALRPLWIRYMFKMAIFYEFQWKHTKSLRYLTEAYRHTAAYYQYLIQRYVAAVATNSHSRAAGSPRRPTDVAATGHDAVEVALPSSANKAAMLDWSAIVPSPPDDMIHQCRHVADWLNFKLTAAAFESRSLPGMAAANDQWRQHARVFLVPTTNTATAAALPPAWCDWSFIARQRLMLSQLAERHVPATLTTLKQQPNPQQNPFSEEWRLRCAPWRALESASEAFLQLSCALERVQKEESMDMASITADTSSESGDPDRAPFLGGLDSQGLRPLLRLALQQDARQMALRLILRAMKLFEEEQEREKRGFYAEDSYSEASSSRTGARLYYLAGGILLGQKRHAEAAGHLEKAVKFSKGWPGLELAVRKMLIECYETHMPTERTTEAGQSNSNKESSLALASMILDSYFNAEMSSSDLRRALGHFASISGGGNSLKWYRECFNDEDSTMPFTFEVTFPENIFATVGDCVKASIYVKSNLDYAVHVNSLVLMSLAGDLPISSIDLMRAKNASEGSDGGIIIQRQGEILIITELVLPKDLSIIASDDSGNGGEMQGVAGKGSFAKSARPRTAAMTSAGGARMLSADQLPKENATSQGWSMRFLGGKPLKCDGVRMVFYPVQAEKASGVEAITPIELTIEKKKPRTEANIRRTPFEEENYIASAWSRPQIFPLSHGPRSLRVLSPRAAMVVTNMTDPLTDGKAIEGAINRVLLKFQAGSREECSDIKISSTCFTVLISSEGVTKRLVPKSELAEGESSLDMSDPAYRTPVMVLPVNNPCVMDVPTPGGYQLPDGWSMAGDGQGYTGKALPKLKSQEACYVPLDFYRPSADLGDATAADICKTDFYLTITYKQERPTSKKKVSRAQRTSRRRTVRPGRGRGGADKKDEASKEEMAPPSEPTDPVDPRDEVSLEYSGTIVWGRPITAKFEQGVRKNHPSGKFHTSNSLTMNETKNEISLIHGEWITQKCILQATEPDLDAELSAIRYEAIDDPFRTKLISSTDDLVYRAEPADPGRILSGTSMFSAAFTTKVELPDGTADPAVSSLGTLVVDWLPRPLELPFEVSADGKIDGIFGHGPLALENQASSIRFACPQCHVERAPFATLVSVDPQIPTVGQDFSIRYRVENKTEMQQTVAVNWPGDDNSGSLLISGMMEGTISLGPGETQTIEYTAVALASGRVQLPAASLISTNYRTRIVDETSTQPLFVQP